MVGHIVGTRWSVGETVGRIDGKCEGALVTNRVGGIVFFASAPPIRNKIAGANDKK